MQYSTSDCENPWDIRGIAGSGAFVSIGMKLEHRGTSSSVLCRRSKALTDNALCAP